MSFAKFLLILWCRGGYALGITCLMKVFSLLSLIRNLTVSNKDEDTTTLISCIVMWLYAFCVSIPYYPSVGSCNRLFVLGFVRTSYQVNGSQLHTFCFYTNPLYRSCATKIGLLVKIVHKSGAVFDYWSKIVHKCGYLPAFSTCI